MSGLAPHHPSMRRVKRCPRGFGAKRMEPDESRFLEAQALDVFSRMTMNGHTFVEALAAIYLTGLHDAVASQQDPPR